MSQTNIVDVPDNADKRATDGVAEWLQCRRRLQSAARAMLHHGSIWQPDDMPERVANKADADYREHIEAAHSLLRATLCLLAKGELLELPYEINPTPDTAAVLSYTLQEDEAYFLSLEKAVHMILSYFEHERKLLQLWSAQQAEAIRDDV
ncbi:hypothetical protein OH77DRAFT_1593527 [Trametes cingulata]|nr:hypothetical protein OH77DRAFT_1593527 [Trametes cingulata]